MTFSGGLMSLTTPLTFGGGLIALVERVKCIWQQLWLFVPGLDHVGRTPYLQSLCTNTKWQIYQKMLNWIYNCKLLVYIRRMIVQSQHLIQNKDENIISGLTATYSPCLSLSPLAYSRGTNSILLSWMVRDAIIISMATPSPWSFWSAW